MTSNPKVFLRDATGLVREFSWFDAFIISSAIILPSLWSYSSQIAFVSSADPGADFVLSEHLGFIFSLPVAIVYVLLAVAMPRSGGDYVWISRHIHAGIGFMAGWAFWLSVLATVGTAGFIFPGIIIPVFLGSFGYSLGIPSLISAASTFATPTTIFIYGILMLAACSVIAGLGPKLFSRIMIVLFTIIMISAFASFFVLAGATHSQFMNAINGLGVTNGTYDDIMNSAKANGWTFAPITLGVTLTSTPLAILLFTGQNYSAATSGEVKNVRSSMRYAIIGSLAFAWILNVIGTQLSVNVVGYPFIQAATSLGSKWPLAAPPWMPLFISILTHNVFLLIIIQAGWLLTYFWWTSSALLVSTRYVFAFAFDRAFPSKFSSINERFHTPLFATVLNIVVAAIFITLATFTSYIGLFLNTVAIQSTVWGLGSVVAIVLPFKKRQLTASLIGGNWRIPFLSVIGFISLGFMLANIYFAFTTPAIGPSTPGADAIIATIFITGLLAYAASYYYHKSKGVNLSLTYSEIPPE